MCNLQRITILKTYEKTNTHPKAASSAQDNVISGDIQSIQSSNNYATITPTKQYNFKEIT